VLWAIGDALAAGAVDRHAGMDYRHIKTFSPRTKLGKNIYGRVVSRWNELSLPSKPPEITVFETEITVFETENRERMSDGE
jgi:hypothetical protein